MIQVENLSKSFNNKTILNNLSFSVNKGEVVAIIGPSGSGKSTLIRCLNLLESPENGTLTIGDASITLSTQHNKKSDIASIRTKTGMVFQSFNLFPHYTALKNVMIGLIKTHRLSKAEAKSRAETYLKKVGLDEHKDKYPNQLSGGQQQRVAIARALALEPEVLLLDEPTSALDPELVHEVLDVIRSIADEHKTLVIVTHELNFAREVADRMMFVDQGEIVAFEPAEQFFNTPKHPRITQFMSKLSF